MLIPIIAFVVVFLVFFVTATIFLRVGRNDEQTVLVGNRQRRLLFGGLTGALSIAIPTGAENREKLQRFLRHAGHYHRSALAEYLALRNAAILSWLALVVTFIAVGTEPGDGLLAPSLVVGAFGLVVCYALPRLLLESMARHRLQRIEDGLPDALDMITMCMSGGLPLQTALVRVSDELQESRADLAYELRIVGRQMEAGSLSGSLRRFAERIDTADVQTLSAIIGQTDAQGSGVAAAFQDFADTVRLTRRQRAEEQGNKTTFKLLFPLIFCLAPPVYLMLLAPAALELRSFMDRETRDGGILEVGLGDVGEVMGDPITEEEIRERHPVVNPAASE